METANLQNQSPEIWQVEVNGQIYDTNLEEMKLWIAEGSLLPMDKVRRGNLRWLDANKVPLLYGFFNAKQLAIPPPNVSTTTIPLIQTNLQNDKFSTTNHNEVNFQQASATNTFDSNQTQFHQNATQLPPQVSCVIHEGEEPKFSCETCLNLFCKNCPNTYGSVKICPMCEAMCQPLVAVFPKQERQSQIYYPPTERFSFSDFGNSLAFPFKYKASLIFGAILYMFFTLGQGAFAIGGIYMIVGSIFCAMLANMFTFGIMANTVDNFSQGKTESNFMPNFEDFNIWDDVVHPFFLSIGVYILSFGPLIVLIIVMTFFVMNSIKQELTPLGQKAVSVTAPQLQPGYEDASQISQIKTITEKINEKNAQRNQQIENAENGIMNPGQSYPNNEEEEFNELNRQINQHKKQQLESTIGKTSETQQAEFRQFVQKMFGIAIPFLLLGGIALLWGLFYFPAACAVAAYTRNFGSTINPMIGLDTIKRLGFDYVKILGMTILLSIMSGIIGIILKIVLSPFDLPRIGNIPAIAIGGLFTFYFSVVFSVILGYALYKNAEKLNLYR